MTNPTQITAEPGLPYLDIIREFDAPVDAVFRAHTDPALFSKWTGPRQLEMEILEFEAVTGGKWQYISRDPQGNSYGFRGVFHTVDRDALIIQTFEFDGAAGQVSTSTARFKDLRGRTRVSTHIVFPSMASRDGMVASDMEFGVLESHSRLDELLTSAEDSQPAT